MIGRNVVITGSIFVLQFIFAILVLVIGYLHSLVVFWLCRSVLIWYWHQRWSPRGRPWPRGHNLKSLASKVKFLASKTQVLESWPVLGLRTALFLELLKVCGAPEKFFGNRFFLEIAWKFLLKNFFFSRSPEKFFWRPLFIFFWESDCACVLGLGLEHSCPWPRDGMSSVRLFLALASDIFLCPWP